MPSRHIYLKPLLPTVFTNILSLSNFEIGTHLINNGFQFRYIFNLFPS